VAVKMAGESGVQRKWFAYCSHGLGTHCAREGGVETSSRTPQNIECQCYGHEFAVQLSSCVAEAGDIVLNGDCEENTYKRKQFRMLLAWEYKCKMSHGDDNF